MNLMGVVGRRMGFAVEESQRVAAHEAVTSGAAVTASYLVMNAAATVLAGCGLLQNSPAVIIGAMLVAMLLGPIVGIALALSEGDLKLLRRSLVAEIVGVVWVLSIAYVLGMTTRSMSIGSEILNRTAPTILDLLIGLVGGMAGAFTFVSTGLSGVIVGVAIATALCPPLTSCGILLARHLPGLAGGAFLLFLTNFTAITVGATMVFWLAGNRPHTTGEARRVFGPRLVTIVLLVMLGIHLTIALRNIINQTTMENNIQSALSNNLTTPGARLDNVTLKPGRGRLVAWAVVRTPQPISPEQVAHLNDLVNRATGNIIDLHVRSVLTTEATREGYIYRPEVPLGD